MQESVAPHCICQLPGPKPHRDMGRPLDRRCFVIRADKVPLYARGVTTWLSLTPACSAQHSIDQFAHTQQGQTYMSAKTRNPPSSMARNQGQINVSLQQTIDH